MANRAISIVLLLLGLAIGICGGLEQAILGRSIYLVSHAAENVDAKAAAAQLAEARPTLDTCFNLTTISMYLGIAVGLVACAELYWQEKQNANAGTR